MPVLIQHDGEVVDENGVYLNDDGTVTLSCIVSDCEATGEWTSSSDASFTSTDLSITVTTPAIYTCTATGCGSASINVQGNVMHYNYLLCLSCLFLHLQREGAFLSKGFATL